jgi:hypothetical protein
MIGIDWKSPEIIEIRSVSTLTPMAVRKFFLK